MTEPKTCSTCHWWFRFDDDKNILWGRCVYHIGVKGTEVQRVKFGGTIETRDDFGCVKHEEDKRECREQS